MADLTPTEAAKHAKTLRWWADSWAFQGDVSAARAGADALEQVAGLQQRLDKIEQAARHLMELGSRLGSDTSWSEYGDAERALRQALDEIERDRGGT